MVTIAPLQQKFNWKPYGEDAANKLNTGNEIFYILDGNEPDSTSTKYEGPFKMEGGEVKAISISNGSNGTVSSQVLEITEEGWGRPAARLKKHLAYRLLMQTLDLGGNQKRVQDRILLRMISARHIN